MPTEALPMTSTAFDAAGNIDSDDSQGKSNRLGKELIAPDLRDNSRIARLSFYYPANVEF